MRRDDIHSVLIIGSGPIVIGQACEFDYSGTQACKALKALGYKIILVNSNPATIMTDPGMADATYIEPLNIQRIEEIIVREKPDALLPNLGGQTGLNLASELDKAGILERHGVKVIGVNLKAIERGEDRLAFKEAMRELGIEMPKSELAYQVEEAEAIASRLGYPVVIRPAFTLGGTGGGLVYNLDELRTVAARGLAASMIHQILVEESVLGWEELEVEVVRDATGKMITVCFIENIDPMGVHTGDSFCSAPMLDVPDTVQKRLQAYAYKIVESIGVIGGTNVQFAYHRESDRIVIIEINPRTSRSSALASKATGFPIALVSAKLAAGLTLKDLPYHKGGGLDAYTPSGDYVVVKFARWAFEKYPGSIDKLGTQMKAVGEVMSIGTTYKEAFQKAVRSLEIGRYGLGFAKNFNSLSLQELMNLLSEPSSERQFVMYEALRKGASVDALYETTRIKPWFIEQMKELVETEEELLKFHGTLPPDELLRKAKLEGFADRYLAKLLGLPEREIKERRIALGCKHTWKAVPVSGADAEYYYSSYHGESSAMPKSGKKKVMILGGGPNRVGQGIEFDYCCVHAALALREAGYETIMVNCNPETVSTDYDTSDRLYFEPLTVEDVLAIYEAEQPEGVIVQFGGQTPLNIARELAESGVRILGTSIDSIDAAEDRDLFRGMMDKLGIPMPESGMASSAEEAIAVAKRIGYPVMARPSFVLGGRGMEVVQDELEMEDYAARAFAQAPERPLLIDRFLQDALECEADAISDGEAVIVPAVMEHIELAGVHSGDSACVIPSVNISTEQLTTIEGYTRTIASALKVVGLMNMQYAIEKGKVYVLEANPRASRTVPLVSKVCAIPMARIATALMTGTKIADAGLKLPLPALKHCGVKESVFPFDKFPEVDPVLGPEMRSTGEVLGLAESFGLAYCKAQEAAGASLPSSGTVLMSLYAKGPLAARIGREFAELGFKILATEGTRDFLAKEGIPCELVRKLAEGRPNIVDAIVNGEIQLVVNTPFGKKRLSDDSYIRKSAIRHRIPYITTLAAALATVKGIRASREGRGGVRPLQEYHAGIR